MRKISFKLDKGGIWNFANFIMLILKLIKTALENTTALISAVDRGLRDLVRVSLEAGADANGSNEEV